VSFYELAYIPIPLWAIIENVSSNCVFGMVDEYIELSLQLRRKTLLHGNRKTFPTQSPNNSKRLIYHKLSTTMLHFKELTKLETLYSLQILTNISLQQITFTNVFYTSFPSIYISPILFWQKEYQLHLSDSKREK